MPTAYQLFVSKHWNRSQSWGDNISRIAKLWKSSKKKGRGVLADAFEQYRNPPKRSGWAGMPNPIGMTKEQLDAHMKRVEESRIRNGGRRRR